MQIEKCKMQNAIWKMKICTLKFAISNFHYNVGGGGYLESGIPNPIMKSPNQILNSFSITNAPI
jgi:hypothetical protein